MGFKGITDVLADALNIRRRVKRRRWASAPSLHSLHLQRCTQAGHPSNTNHPHKENTCTPTILLAQLYFHWLTCRRGALALPVLDAFPPRVVRSAARPTRMACCTDETLGGMRAAACGRCATRVEVVPLPPADSSNGLCTTAVGVGSVVSMASSKAPPSRSTRAPL